MCKLQDQINASPVEHEKCSYKVRVTDKNNNFIRTVLLLASSERRARLAGVKIARDVFSNKKAANATATINTKTAVWT